MTTSIFDQAHPKSIEITFHFPEFASAYKKSANFRVLWPDWPHPFLILLTPKFFNQLSKSGYFIDLFWRYGWLKNHAIWLAENTYLRNKHFLKYGIGAGTQKILYIFIIDQIQLILMARFSNNSKKHCFWPILGAKIFSWKICLCQAELHMAF